MKIELDAKTITEVISNFLSNHQASSDDSQKTYSKSDYDFFVGKKVLIRHHLMGVNFGTVKSINDKNIVLEKSRKLWRWCIENVGVALEDVATKGLHSDTTKSKISDFVDVVLIPHNENLCGVYLASETAIKSIESAPVAHQN